MKLVERILVGLDFRPGTENVLQTACVAAKQFRSELSLAHVIPPLASVVLPEEQGNAETLVELAKTESANRLAGYRADLKESGITTSDPKTLDGVPFDRLIDYADDIDANVIMVGAGSKEDDRVRLGITAERLCRKSSRPVWLVHSQSSPNPGSILCPVDFSRASARALKNAIFLARSFGSRLNVLNVIPPTSTLYGWIGLESKSSENLRTERRQQAFDEFLQPFYFQDIEWNRLVRQGSPDREILSAATDTGASLIVMGSVGGTALSRVLLGRVAERVLQSAPCSMLLVKDEDAFRLQIADQVTDIESHFQNGVQLLKEGFVEEARRHFHHCVSTNVMFAPGWEALADCYQRLGDPARAEECRSQAQQVHEALNWQRVQADIRSQHPLWRRGK